MPYQLQTTQQQGAIKLDMLNYGMPDTEKTLAIARLQSVGFNPLVIACDPGGMVTLSSFNIPFIEISKVSDVREVLTDIKSGKLNMRQFDMICVDGASNFSYMCLKETGENSNDRRLDYGRGWIEFRKSIDDLRRLPFHFYINAFEAEIKNAPEGARFGAMAEGNKFAIQFTGLFNTVCRSFRYKDNQGNMSVAVQMQFDGTHLARERRRVCAQYENSIDVAVKKILNIP